MVAITLNEVKKFCKENGFELEGLTRFATVKIDKKPIVDGEAVVGLEGRKIRIFRKDIFGRIVLQKFDIEPDIFEFGINDLYDFLVGQHSLTINIKNKEILISDYIEGDIKRFLELLDLKGFQYTQHDLLYICKKFLNYTGLPILLFFTGIEVIFNVFFASNKTRVI
ncbi:hypothetical protein [Caminibacter pacificus]